MKHSEWFGPGLFQYIAILVHGWRAEQLDRAFVSPLGDFSGDCDFAKPIDRSPQDVAPLNEVRVGGQVVRSNGTWARLGFTF